MPLPNYSNPPVDATLFFEASPRTLTANGTSAILDIGPNGSCPNARVMILPITVTSGTIAVSLQQSDSPTFASGNDTLRTLPTVSATQADPTSLVIDNNLVTKRYLRLSYATASTPNVTIPAAFITVD